MTTFTLSQASWSVPCVAIMVAIGRSDTGIVRRPWSVVFPRARSPEVLSRVDHALGATSDASVLGVGSASVLSKILYCNNSAATGFGYSFGYPCVANTPESAVADNGHRAPILLCPVYTIFFSTQRPFWRFALFLFPRTFYPPLPLYFLFFFAFVVY